MINKSLLFFCFVCFTLLAEVKTSFITLNDAKVHYTLEIMKHVTWPNEDKRKQFVIGLYGKNNDLFATFHKNKPKLSIRDKSLTIVKIKPETPPLQHQSYDLIIVAKNKLFILNKITKRYPKALIVSDGKVSREKLMIGLVTYIQQSKEQLKIVLNRKNLVNKGFIVSNRLINFAGTKSDLSEQLDEKELHLNKLHAQIQNKETKLVQLNQSLSKNKQVLQEIKVAFFAKQTALVQQTQQLNELRTERQQLFDKISNHKKNLQQQVELVAQQKQLVAQQQAEIAQQQLKLQQLKTEIKESENALKQQLLKINAKNKRIIKNERTISSQRLVLYIAIAVTLVLIFLKLNLVRLGRLRKQANEELTTLNEQLYEMATIDSMSKLFNRRHFLESAQLHLAQLQRSKLDSALLMIDIDHFKQVNDSYGHAMGDQAIITLAKLLRDSLRDYDIVGRLGGEEFSMLLSHCEKESAIVIAERIRSKATHLAITFEDSKIYLTISIGLTVLSNKDTDIHQVVQRADKALYHAKENGRDQVAIYDDK